ncbi:EamA family transporter [Flindersiella endophytica]
MTLTIAVLCAAVLHAIWNALAHFVSDKVVSGALVSTAFVVCGLVALPFVGMPAAPAWPYLLGSVVVHFLYMLALLQSYRLGAFNQVYPLARGMSPWVVAIVAVTVIGEPLSAVQTVGVVVVSIGLGLLVLAKGSPKGRYQGGWEGAVGRPHKQEVPAILAATLTGLMIATYTVIDGVGVRQSGSPLGYAACLFLLHGLTVVGFAFLRRGSGLARSMASLWKLGATAGVCSVLAYALVLWAQAQGALATVAALRETSVIVGAIIGAVFFKEPFGRWRTVATVVVATGIVLLNLT